MQPTLNPNSFIIPATIMDFLMNPSNDKEDIKDDELPDVAAKYWPGVAYTSAIEDGASFSSSELSHIPVGMQEHSVIGTVIEAEGTDSHTSLDNNSNKDSDKNNEGFREAKKYQWAAKNKILSQREKELLERAETSILSKAERTELYNIQAGSSAKIRALESQKRRIGKKLLLTERAQNITIVCAETGIVAQMDIPVIKGFALVWNSPFSSLDNCRGMAQRGRVYLQNLDTQILAGILIKIAESYDLFRFQPHDSGAQKNAIVRTADRDSLIKAILMIENLVHSGNYKYLPKLSLSMDVSIAATGIESRLRNYLGMLADAIADPDKEEYDPDYVVPRAKPDWIIAKERKLSAKESFSKDMKELRVKLKELDKEFSDVNPKLIKFIADLTQNEAIMLPGFQSIIPQLIAKLRNRYPDSANQIRISELLLKYESSQVDALDELSDSLSEKEEQIEEEQEEIEDIEETEEDNENAFLLATDEEINEYAREHGHDPDYPTSSPSSGDLVRANEHVSVPVEDIIPPAGLSAIEQIIWKKKYKQATMKAVQNTSIPSTHVYVPSDKKNKLGG
jgi:hypothetical protein